MINKNKELIRKNRGQVAIIVLLVSAVVLTLGLSASKKTVTDTKIDTDEESLKKAFNTAESAINNYLNIGSTAYTSEGNIAIINSTPIGNSFRISSEGQVLANSNQLFWLVNHNADGSIGNAYYSSGSVSLDVDGDFNGALKVDYFYIEGGIYRVQRLGCRYDGNSNPLFNLGFNDNCSTLTLTGSPLLISIVPMGSSTSLAISGTSDFPLQGEELTSSSTIDNSVKTQIKTRYIYQIPPFMMDAITVKNVIE